MTNPNQLQEDQIMLDNWPYALKGFIPKELYETMQGFVSEILKSQVRIIRAEERERARNILYDFFPVTNRDYPDEEVRNDIIKQILSDNPTTNE